MDPLSLAACVEMENVGTKQLNVPAPVHHQSSPSAMELDEMTWGVKLNGPLAALDPSTEITSTTPNEMESSRPPSPEAQDTAGMVQTMWKYGRLSHEMTGPRCS